MYIKELTGKRNLHYNRRHRLYGREMKMYDIDSVEYHHLTKQPVALVETKFGLIRDIDLNNDEFECLWNTSEKLDVPLFCLVYYPFNNKGHLLDADMSYDLLTHIQYVVIPVNSQAKKLVPRQCRMTEAQWVGVLYKLRGLPPNSDFPLCDTWKEVRLPFVVPRP